MSVASTQNHTSLTAVAHIEKPQSNLKRKRPSSSSDDSIYFSVKHFEFSDIGNNQKTSISNDGIGHEDRCASKKPRTQADVALHSEYSYIDKLIQEYDNGNNPKCDLERTIKRATGMIKSMSDNNKVYKAIKKLSQAGVVDSILFNIALTKCENLGDYKLAKKIFKRMPKEFINCITYNKLISINASLYRWKSCIKLIKLAIKNNIYKGSLGFKIAKKSKNIYLNFHRKEILASSKKSSYGHAPSIPLEVAKAIFYFHLEMILKAQLNGKPVFLIVGQNGVDYLRDGIWNFVQETFEQFSIEEHYQIRGQLVIK